MTLERCDWWRHALKQRRRSPILLFANTIAGSPLYIAPERAADLQEILDRHKLAIEFEDRPKFAIRVSLESHQVFLPIAAMEYVWAQCLRFWVVTTEYLAAQKAGDTSFDIHGNKRRKDAAKVAAWSAANLASTGKEPWPADLPRPKAKPRDEDTIVANELFFGAMAWIILHEIAHVERNHAEFSGTYSQQQEKEADLFATDWVLSKISGSVPIFNKRAFCVAAALLCLQSFETVAAPRWRGSHPPAHERISYCLGGYRGPSAEKVTALLVVCLQVLFGGTNVRANVDGESFGDILDELFVDIARRNS